ncbi:sulfur carrier protein ThiS [Corynebacterium otitidis]
MSTPTKVSFTVNDEPATGAGVTVGALVDERAESRKGVAVAVDGDVVPRSEWDERFVADGEAVDILTAVQGG